MSAPDPKSVLKLAEEMVAAEEHLASLRERWEAMFGSAATPERKAVRQPAADGVSSKVLDAINRDPLSHFDAGDLERILGIPRRKIEGALFNLYTAKKIARHSRGNYESILDPDADVLQMKQPKEAA